MGFNLLKNIKVIFFLKWQIVLLIMLITKCSFCWLVRTNFKKIFEDHDMAINLIVKLEKCFTKNDGVINHSFQFPLYPFFLFILYCFFGVNLKVAIIFNVLLSSLLHIYL